MGRFLTVLGILLLPSLCMADLPALTELRYCGTPVRNQDGTIHRRADVLAAFKKAHPCPATGKTTGACPGWYMDHVVSLACGGCDAVSNLQWLPEKEWRAKSLFERKIYCQ